MQQGRLRTCKHCFHPPIAETDPDFALWFAEPQIPRERSRYSHTLADFYCQECGSLVRDKSIHTVYQRKYVPCPYCRDGMSYPERYVNAFLAQLNISFHRQYMVPFEKEGKRSHYKYDFYDEPQGILLEVHGLQHFAPDVFKRIGGWSLEMIQERDVYKRQVDGKHVIGTMNRKLTDVEGLLGGHGFLRVHQSYMVNMKYIVNIASYRLELEPDIILHVPRNRYPYVKREYAIYKGDSL